MIESEAVVSKDLEQRTMMDGCFSPSPGPLSLTHPPLPQTKLVTPSLFGKGNLACDGEVVLPRQAAMRPKLMRLRRLWLWRRKLGERY